MFPCEYCEILQSNNCEGQLLQKVNQSKRSVLCSVFIESAIESAIKTNTE